MSGKFFADTNILIYSVSDDSRKRNIAERLLIGEEVVVSPQVISEFVAVALRKKILERTKVIEYARKFLYIFNVATISSSTVSTALDIMTRYQFSYWDSLILAAALESSCEIVYSEDLQSGQIIEERLTVINPFA